MPPNSSFSLCPSQGPAYRLTWPEPQITQDSKHLHTHTSCRFCFSGWTLTDTGCVDCITWLYHNLVNQFPVVGYCTELSCCPFGTISPLTVWNCTSPYAVSWMVPGWRLPVRATCAKFASEMPTGSRCYWDTMVVRHNGRVTRHGRFNRCSGFGDFFVSSISQTHFVSHMDTASQTFPRCYLHHRRHL